MRVLFWYCDRFAWNPAIKTLDDAPDAAADEHENAVVAFIHVEPKDVENDNSAETKLVKNAKWMARKWETRVIILHSFTHLGDEKAEPGHAEALIDRPQRQHKHQVDPDHNIIINTHLRSNIPRSNSSHLLAD